MYGKWSNASGIAFARNAQKIGKPNNLNVFASENIKETKYDSQHFLRSPMTDGVGL
jgi:hypothetical protein